jgi:hypothetical protein
LRRPFWTLALLTATCCHRAEPPPREIYIPAGITPAFHADRCLVPWSGYLRCVSAGACRLSDDPFEGDALAERAHRAVVSFDEARAYCASVGKRLPTTREFLRMTEGPAEPEGCLPVPGCCPRVVTGSGVYERNGREWVDLRNARYPHGAQMTAAYDSDPEIVNRMPWRWPWGLDPLWFPTEPLPARGGVFRCVRTAPASRP